MTQRRCISGGLINQQQGDDRTNGREWDVHHDLNAARQELKALKEQ